MGEAFLHGPMSLQRQLHLGILLEELVISLMLNYMGVLLISPSA